MDPRAARPRSAAAGVVLITVLWIMVGLSLLALTLAATVRTEATLARASGEAEQAYFFARGAMEAVLYRLAYPDPDPEKRQALFPYSGGMNHYRLRSRNLRCHLALMDEAGRLDLNAAAPETLERLLRIVGESPVRAEALAAAIAAWRTPDPRSGASGPPRGPRRFRFVEELLQVPGFGRELLYGQARRGRGRADGLPAGPDGLPHRLHRHRPGQRELRARRGPGGAAGHGPGAGPIPGGRPRPRPAGSLPTCPAGPRPRPSPF